VGVLHLSTQQGVRAALLLLDSVQQRLAAVRAAQVAALHVAALAALALLVVAWALAARVRLRLILGVQAAAAVVVLVARERLRLRLLTLTAARVVTPMAVQRAARAVLVARQFPQREQQEQTVAAAVAAGAQTALVLPQALALRVAQVPNTR
jgi:hypothetical protein